MRDVVTEMFRQLFQMLYDEDNQNRWPGQNIT